MGIKMKQDETTDILTNASLSYNHLMKSNVLGTKTSIKAITQDDLDTLAMKNRKETGFNTNKLATILSNNVSNACFGG